MALPTLDATFASSADLPRKQMLAKWLVEELGSGSIADYYDLPERYLWAKIAVAAGAPKTEADYISLPKNYAWSDIYNAVSGDIDNSTVVLSGAGLSEANGIFIRDGEENGRPKWMNVENNNSIIWDASSAAWNLGANGDFYWGYEDVAYPWLVQTIEQGSGDLPIPTLAVQTPNHTDWSENVALGHIAAAYRGDTGNPANLATYIDWPWRYKVASIIDHLIGNYNAVIVSGAGTASSNGTYIRSGTKDGKPRYISGDSFIEWSGGETNTWDIFDSTLDDYSYFSSEDSKFPWNIIWSNNGGSNPAPTLTPTNV